jgi:bla regulator protein BlaR1
VIYSHLWQSTVFVIIAAGFAFLLRKSQARVRYGIWLAASLKFLVPFSLLVALGNQFSWRTELIVDRSVASVIAAASEGGLLQGPLGVAAVQEQARLSLAAILGIIWAVGALTVLGFWMLRWRQIRRTVHCAVPVEVGRELEALRRVELNLRVARPIDLRLSGGLLEPGVFGILKPTLILPAGIGCHLSKAQLEGVIAHEISHIRRRDNLTAFLHMVVEVLFWFHPCVWWMGSRLIEERERACDEDVLRLTAQPTEYAEGIIRVCELYLQSPVLAVSGVTGADLKKRIESIVTFRSVPAFNALQRFSLISAVVAAIATPLFVGLLSAVPVAAAPDVDPTLRFAVASVRSNNVKDARPMVFFQPGGRLQVVNTDLKTLIGDAYGVTKARLSGGPDWIESDRFDIEAKAESEMFGMRALAREDTDKLRMMLRNLLADRFRVRVRIEPHLEPVYALVVDRDGFKLKPTERDCNAIASDGKALCHSFSGGARSGLTVQGMDMTDFAEGLGRFGFADRLVVNKTTLEGVYDFYLKWTPDSLRAAGAQANDVTDGRERVVVDPNGPDLQQALREQLGLKLDPQKGQVDSYIIESAEKPTEN